jgi:hypothetical protein
MILTPSSDFVPLSAEVAADFLKRGGWSKKEAVLILNGLDPRKNVHHLEFDNDDFRVDPMLGTYLTAIDLAFPKMQVLPVGDVLRWATVGTKQHPRRQPLTLSRELQAALGTSDFKLLERRIRHVHRRSVLRQKADFKRSRTRLQAEFSGAASSATACRSWNLQKGWEATTHRNNHP